MPRVWHLHATGYKQRDVPAVDAADLASSLEAYCAESSARYTTRLGMRLGYSELNT